jgi:hypothetical protein
MDEWVFGFLFSAPSTWLSAFHPPILPDRARTDLGALAALAAVPKIVFWGSRNCNSFQINVTSRNPIQSDFGEMHAAILIPSGRR